jgi:hypothetical protein
LPSNLNENQRKALHHVNELGAEATKRRALSGKEKIPVVMHEWAAGKLHSGSGKIVPHDAEHRDQAIAISMSEAGMSKKK